MDEKIKQPLMFGAIGCAITIMIYQFAYQFSLDRGEHFTVLGVLGGIAMIAATIRTIVVAKKNPENA